ncbi:MAG: hypothetical protein V4489_09745, partial [Chlamydiota bacterium]
FPRCQEDEGLVKGEAQGLAKGLVIGKSKRNKEIAKEMLLDDEPEEKIIKYSGLTSSEITELKNENTFHTKKPR